jgi:hypothetical protein
LIAPCNPISAWFFCGIILDGFMEQAFPPGHLYQSLPGCSGNFNKIPLVVVVARLR